MGEIQVAQRLRVRWPELCWIAAGDAGDAWRALTHARSEKGPPLLRAGGSSSPASLTPRLVQFVLREHLLDGGERRDGAFDDRAMAGAAAGRNQLLSGSLIVAALEPGLLEPQRGPSHSRSSPTPGSRSRRCTRR
jgi:hypothetical protein